MISGQGKMETNSSGASRESNEGRGRFDLLPYEAMEALAKWYELGASKYGERNWEKGISVKDCINRMVRHAMKASNGWMDEDHLSAVMWNAAAAITMTQRMPEFNDHGWQEIEEKSSSRLYAFGKRILTKDEIHNVVTNTLSSPKSYAVIFDDLAKAACAVLNAGLIDTKTTPEQLYDMVIQEKYKNCNPWPKHDYKYIVLWFDKLREAILFNKFGLEDENGDSI